MGMRASTGDQMTVKAHVLWRCSRVRTEEEVVDAILTVSGIKGVDTCLPGAVEMFVTLTIRLFLFCRPSSGLGRGN